MSRSNLHSRMVKSFFAAIFCVAITTISNAQTVSFTPVTQNGGGLQTFSKAVDFNSDGREDLFVFPDNSHTSFNILLSTGDGSYRQVGPFTTPDNASINSVAYGDFNGDGFADIMVAGSATTGGGLYELLNNSYGHLNY